MILQKSAFRQHLLPVFPPLPPDHGAVKEHSLAILFSRTIHQPHTAL